MNPLQDLGNHSLGRVQAPVGQVYLVKTVCLSLIKSCPHLIRVPAPVPWTHSMRHGSSRGSEIILYVYL